MTREEIISLARAAGFQVRNDTIRTMHSNGSWVGINEELERFAGLVAAAEREACAAQKQQQAEPVAAQCRFEGEKEWKHCNLAHHNLVQAHPKEWPHYETRALYAHPPAVAAAPQPPTVSVDELIATEREACAKTCEDFADGTSAYEVHHRFAAYKCAEIVRKRGGDENIS